MHSAKRPDRPIRRRRKSANRYGKSVVRWLIFCFPAGLMMMWSDRCRWPRALKSTISAGIALLIMAVVLPQTLPPERTRGGVQIVSTEPVIEAQGPKRQKSDEDCEVYVPAYIEMPSLIVQPTPTPEPVYVYCNVGGKYYHAKKCRYVKKTSGRVTLTRALDVGYKRCTECDAPAE